MEIAFVGLGRMGGGMTHRLLDDGHTVFGYAPSDKDRDTLDERGGKAAGSLEEMVSLMTEKPRVVWSMVPAGQITEDTISNLAGLLEEGDIVVDGGNTNFRDDQRRAKALEEKGIEFIDAGTSGGVWGYDVGYCLMVGGSDSAVERLAPVLTTLAPPDGWLHCGPVGSGEGRWTGMEAINEAVPAPVIALSLMLRQRSRQEESYSAKVNAALRQQFGGHAVKAALVQHAAKGAQLAADAGDGGHSDAA